MSKLTPPVGAGVDRLTVNVNVVVALLPSAIETSLIEIVGLTERMDVPCWLPARARIVESPELNADTEELCPVVGATVALLASLESQINETFEISISGPLELLKA